MLTNQRVEDIDQLLNQLEREAQSNLPTSQFFSHLMQRLRILLECDSVAVLAPTNSTWLAIAQHGNYSATITESFSVAFSREVPRANIQTTDASQANAAQPNAIMGTCEQQHWYAVPLRTNNYAKGCLLVSLSTAPPSAAVPGMLELIAAFAEVLTLRQMADLEAFLDHRWEKLQQLTATLLDTSYTGDSAALLVNQLIPILSAARVTLCHTNALGNVRVQKISGAPTVDPNSRVVRNLAQVAQIAHKNLQPQLRQQRASNTDPNPTNIDDEGLFTNSLSIPLVDHPRSKRCEHTLVIEWESYDEMLAATASVVHMLPTLSLAWRQHSRWQRIPAPLRMIGERRWSSTKWKSRIIAVLALTLIAVLAYMALVQPYPLTIEAIGTIEPEKFRTIFTSLDGYVSELLVEDGQLVEVDQPLARIQTPELDLRIGAIVGELRTIAEKRNALQVASNQLNLNAADSLVNQNRLAAEIKQLETQESNLNSQLKMLREEASKSLIVSPIRGKVVAKDIRQQLASRPLRRGDALFRIVDLEGPWHLRIHVADRDSGYVMKAADQSASEHKPVTQSLKFVLDSLPGEQFDAHVNWVAGAVQNRTGEGCFVEMRASVDRSIVDKTHMGASVRAYFRCDDQPLWFVWSRPIVEAVQRRLWFWS